MDKILSYTLRPEDLERTAGGLVNLILKNCVRVTGHEISAAKFLEDGITCDGRLVHVSERILPGQTIRVRLPEERDAGKLAATPGRIRVLYEDEDLIAVDKAAGEVVHPCPGHYMDTIANHLTWYLQEKSRQDYSTESGKSGTCRAGGAQDRSAEEEWRGNAASEKDSEEDTREADASGLRIIGRLDKETSGVLVFARSRAAAARLQRQRREGTFVRTYLAVCEGIFGEDEKSGVIDRDMEKVPGVLMMMRTCAHGMRAVTHYEVLEEREGRSLVRFHIETGRTHQIRVHMASIGHPLCGDTLYGKDTDMQGDLSHVKSMPDGEQEGSRRALLHEVSVECRQPFTGENIRIVSALPSDIRSLLCGSPLLT